MWKLLRLFKVIKDDISFQIYCVNFAKVVISDFQNKLEMYFPYQGIKIISRFAYSMNVSIMSSCRQNVVLICIDDHALEGVESCFESSVLNYSLLQYCLELSCSLKEIIQSVLLARKKNRSSFYEPVKKTKTKKTHFI